MTNDFDFSALPDVFDIGSRWEHNATKLVVAIRHRVLDEDRNLMVFGLRADKKSIASEEAEVLATLVARTAWTAADLIHGFTPLIDRYRVSALELILNDAVLDDDD
jgi:hypothetical protein